MTDRLCLLRTGDNRNSWASLAAALGRAGLLDSWRVSLADGPGRVPERARVVALSFATLQLEQARDWVERLRRPGRVLVAGGAHPSADPQGTLALGVDHVVVGEGEPVFPGLLERLAAGDPERRVWRARERCDLAAALHVEPRLGLFPFVEISRGCNRRCAFCQTPALFGPMRHRPAAVVAEGVARAVAGGFRRFRLLSPDAFAYGGGGRAARREALELLLARLAEAGARELFVAVFPAEVRPEHVEPELLELVRRRCRNTTLHLGAQSGSERVLGLMHRGHTTEHVRRAVRLVLEAGLRPLVDVLFGFPGEQEPDRRQTLELIDWVLGLPRTRVHAHYYLPLPGAPAWPRPPEPLEPPLLERLGRLERSRRLGGDWRRQAQQARRILRWREQGLIRC